MPLRTIAQQRLYNQRLAGTEFDRPDEIVRWLGAVQSQAYLSAQWALGLRLCHATEALIERAFTDGTILRTHVLRPTWHFVTPADIRWMLELTGPRVQMKNGTMYRRLELDAATFARSHAAIARALEGEHFFTRAELGAALTDAGIVADGSRLTHLVMQAELDAVICSGPRRGKQFTYALLDERAPNARALPRDQALAELITRYFTSHGPATAHDFARWSGLTVTDTKAGLEMVGSALVEETIDGAAYWRASSTPSADVDAPAALLLPPFDEFTVGYTEHAELVGQAPKNGMIDGVIVMNGQVVGHWKRTLRKDEVAIEVSPARAFTAAEHAALADAADRYGAFLGLPATLA